MCLLSAKSTMFWWLQMRSTRILYSGENKFVPAASVAEGKYQDILLTLNLSSKTFNLCLTLIHSHIVIINDKLREIYDKFANGLNRTEVSVQPN